MLTVEGIFQKYGGPTNLGRAIGVRPSAASEMRRRGTIPVRYWPRLVADAATKGFFDVNNDALVAMHSEAEAAA